MNLKSDAAQEILESSHDAIVVVNAEGCVVYANNRAEQLFAYESGEMTGKKVEALMPDMFREKHETHRKNFVKSPRSRPAVSGLGLKAQRKDGRIFEAEIALTPVETDEGMLISSTIRDISADDTSEAYFKNILESAPDAMVIIDHYGKIAVVNHCGNTTSAIGPFFRAIHICDRWVSIWIFTAGVRTALNFRSKSVLAR